MTYNDLLHRLTVLNKDNGTEFTQTDRLSLIKEILRDSSYTILYEGKLSLVYGMANEDKSFSSTTLISTHIDCVYQQCFCQEEEDYWKGTFDNSATNAAVIQLMLENRLDKHVLISFNGDEEISSNGAKEVVNWLNQQNALSEKVIVLDVTNEGWEDEVSYTIENDKNFDILTGFQIVSLLQNLELPCIFLHDALPDESWVYGEKVFPDKPALPCLSLCIPVGGDMHSNEGCLLRKNSIENYQLVLEKISQL